MTATEIATEISEINTALSHIRKGGQSYTISSGPGASSRVVTMADYNSLVDHRNELQAQLNELNETRSFRIRAGW